MLIELKEKSINLPETVLDLPLGRYLQIMKSIVNIPENQEEYFQTANGTLHLIDLVEYFIGESPDDIPIGELPEITNKIIELCNKVGVPEHKDYLIIDGAKYKTRNINELNDITTGEYITLQVYKEKFNNDFYQFAPYVLAVLVRPAQEVRNEETGELTLQMEPFNKRDLDNLEWRAKLFAEKVPAKDLLFVINFFLNGRE